jgi:Tetratricopeptide repeat
MIAALLTILLFAAPTEAVSRAHFVKAQKAFAQHEWRHALEEFTAAGELASSEVPALWFDIGQCQRNLGHPRQAAAAFERYLSLEPDAPDRERVRALIVALGGKPPPLPPSDSPPPVEDPQPAPVVAPASAVVPLPAMVAPPVEPTPTALPLVPTNDEPPPPPPKRNRHWKVWTGVAIGVAVAAVGVGLGVGLGKDGHASTSSGTMSTPTLGSAGTFDTRNHR